MCNCWLSHKYIRDFYDRYHVETSSGVRPASYPMGIEVKHTKTATDNGNHQSRSKPSTVQQQTRVRTSTHSCNHTPIRQWNFDTNRRRQTQNHIKRIDFFFKPPSSILHLTTKEIIILCKNLKQINGYENKLIQHISRMNRPRLMQTVMKYQPTRKRGPELPWKRLACCNLETGAHNWS